MRSLQTLPWRLHFSTWSSLKKNHTKEWFKSIIKSYTEAIKTNRITSYTYTRVYIIYIKMAIIIDTEALSKLHWSPQINLYVKPSFAFWQRFGSTPYYQTIRRRPFSSSSWPQGWQPLVFRRSAHNVARSRCHRAFPVIRTEI